MRQIIFTRCLRMGFLMVFICTFLLLAGCGSQRAGEEPLSGKDVEQPQRDYILVGRVAPLTGALASFGDGTPWLEQQAIDAINKEGGIFIQEAGKKLPVKLKVADSESNPTKAAEVATRLILNDKVDLMVVEHTPDTVNPVCAACERYQIPCISMDAPVEPWLSGGPYEWSYHAFWKVDKVIEMYVDVWDSVPTNKKVGLLLPNDPDGIAWAEVITKKLPGKGYSIVDTGRFPTGTKDYSAVISKFKKENVDIVLACMTAPDFAAAWRQFHEQGYVPKLASIGKAVLFPSDVAAIGGDLGVGLTTELWWSPFHPFKSSLTGETGQQLADKWTATTGKQWVPLIGFKYAAFEVVADVLKRAGTLDKTKIRDAIGQTQMDTMVGPIKYNEEHYSETPLVGGQWVKGKNWPWEIQIVNNKQSPHIAKTGDMIFPQPDN